MKNKTFGFLTLALTLAFAAPVVLTQPGCSSAVTLAPGGAYTDPVIFQANDNILKADDAMIGFVDWATTNAPVLAQWPEIGRLAASISAQKDGWIRDAYLARNAYVTAADAYKVAVDQATKAGGVLPDGTAKDAAKAKLDGLIAALTNITATIANYKSAHPASP
jgi:hypothetical protein